MTHNTMPQEAAPQTDVHADLETRVVVDTPSQAWEASPSGTVWRKPLYRTGGEFGPVTSIVRYAPGGRFRAHAHPEGEEILVLDGVFSDEHGDYPAGSFLFNPHGSRHTPYSVDGCELFVRLRQYPGADRQPRRENTRDPGTWQPGLVPGLSVRPLYTDPQHPEQVALVRWQPGTRFQRHTHWGGEEILVLEGEFCDEHGRYGPGSWIRSPHRSVHEPWSDDGCLIYVRVGGL
jgi:anti-sigma factor ChrR (cupin superfamily)